MSNSRIESFDKLSTRVLSLNKFSALRSNVSRTGMLVKSDSISKLALTSLESKLWISFANLKESLIVYSLPVRGPSNGTEDFASLYIDIPKTDKISQKDWRTSLTILWTLVKLYIIPDLGREGLKSFYCS